MPYLTFETKDGRKRLRDAIGRATVQDKNSRDENLIHAYRGSEYPGSELHVSRTLDQYHYYALPDSNAHDENQVVYQYIKKKHENEDQWRIFMVDQLWLWVFDEGMFLSCLSEPSI
jgi:hypothetical protein